MKEQIIAKIDDVIKYILEKPVEKVTHYDYGILANELREIRIREQQADSGKRWSELMALATSNIGFSGYNS